jgi:hypothetical protein
MIHLLFAALVCLNAPAREIDTNSALIHNAPDWLKRPRAEKVIDRIQTKLEWTIRKINVQFYTDLDAFYKAHSLGLGVLAVTNKSTNTVHIGPSVDTKDFDSVFGHELVHVIIGQKYKDAIPPWVEEGLANHIAKHGKVDYAWLAKQPFPADVRALSHPFTGVVRNTRYHYQASQALAEMIAKKCDMENLLRLSVGKNMDSYLETYCEIKDLNAEFKNWVTRRSGPS